MFKKITTSIILIVFVLTCFCGCGGMNLFESYFVNDRQVAEETLLKIFESLENKDRETLKAVFSKKALKKAKDIDGSIDYLFDLFEGKAVSWDDSGGPIVDESIEHGKKIKEYKSSYSVSTEKQDYIFFLLGYSVDTNHPKNVGLYALRVIKAEDKETQLGYWQDMVIPGIYKP